MDDINEIKKRLIEQIEPVLKDSFMDLVDIEVQKGRSVSYTHLTLPTKRIV